MKEAAEDSRGESEGGRRAGRGTCKRDEGQAFGCDRFRGLLGLLGLLSLRLRGLFGGVVVVGRFLLTNRTVHRVVESIFVSERTNKRQHHSGTCWMEKPSSVLELL